MYVLAIDLGTQSIKAAVVARDGTILGVEHVHHHVDSPYPGWAQQKPDAWWKVTCQAIRSVVSQTGTPPGSIAAVCTCGQMHGPVGVDEEGNVTTEWTQLWCDKRCEEQCQEVRRGFDESVLASITANPVTPGWAGLKVRWIKEHQPDVYDRTRWFLVPKDFVNYRLTGLAATDPSEASGTYLWDAREDCYSSEMASALELDLDRFAPVSPAYQIIGTVTQAAADETGLLPGTPVVAGGGDFLVSLLGLGVAGEGTAADTTGTSALLAVHKEQPLIHPAVQNLRHVVTGWIPFTMLDCGGLSMRWCRDLVNSCRDTDISYEGLIAMAGQVPAGSEGLIFYPYLLGERRAENAAAKGAFLGITLNHTAAHFARAVMEGVALALGLYVKLFKELGVRIDRVYCVGGGSRNMLWNQIKADVFQVPLELTDEPEASLRGAGLLGACGVGLIQDVAEAASAGKGSGIIVQPDPGRGREYHALQEEFERFYDHLLGFWR